VVKELLAEHAETAEAAELIDVDALGDESSE